LSATGVDTAQPLLVTRIFVWRYLLAGNPAIAAAAEIARASDRVAGCELILP
jgi:hypothetical protein